ncbi:hypothetical protein [Desulfobacter curvatus]|nr:hypothetical protein [Desulfobacter curvatus]
MTKKTEIKSRTKLTKVLVDAIKRGLRMEHIQKAFKIEPIRRNRK